MKKGKNYLRRVNWQLKKKSTLQKTLSLLKFKCWYYEAAIADGNEDGVNVMLPDKLPDEIQKLYDASHQ